MHGNMIVGWKIGWFHSRIVLRGMRWPDRVCTCTSCITWGSANCHSPDVLNIEVVLYDLRLEFREHVLRRLVLSGEGGDDDNDKDRTDNVPAGRGRGLVSHTFSAAVHRH